MNARKFLSRLMFFACLAGAVAVFIQARELGTLREKQRLLAAQQETNTNDSSAAIAESADSSPPQSASSELLQLRSQVSQLTERRRELANAAVENEQLHTQLAGRAAKQIEGVSLPPDYIRKNQAQWQGLSTPERTIESFLWTLQNHDLTNLFQVLTPSFHGLTPEQEIGRNSENFFEHTDSLPGLRIVRQEQLPDGSLKVQVEFIPGSPYPQWLTLRRFGAEWKLEMP